MKRGRKSVADLTVVKGNFGDGRPLPPAELTERQQAIWREVTATEPADFFATEALRGLLADYCAHRESSEQVGSIIATFKPEWLKAADGAKRYKLLLQMRELETRASASLATKLRLTNQSRYQPKAAGTAFRNASTGPKPWDF
jgi:hypothetical protein